MRMTTRGRYGLRLMIELAGRYGSGPVLVQAIAAKEGISGKYLHVLVGGLKAAGLVRSARGPSGGYELARAPERITAREVLAALEGRPSPVACVGDLESCERAACCAAHELWCEVAGAIERVLAGVTLAQLAARQAAKGRPPEMGCRSGQGRGAAATAGEPGARPSSRGRSKLRKKPTREGR